MAGNTTIQLKRSSVAGKQPNTAALSIGELAINITDQKLYSSNGTAIFEPAANVTNLRVTANASINSIVANGSLGTAGKVLTSNSVGGIYWATSSGGGGGSVNVDAQYTWTNTQTFTNGVTFNSVIIGTANSANYIGSLPAANVVSDNQLSSNLAYYTNTAGLSTIINNNTANDVYYVGGVTAVNVVSNAQLSANLAHYTNTVSFYLDTLQDVSAGGPTSGQILTWNSTTNQWTPQAPPTVVTGVTPGYYGSFYDANANQAISSTTDAYLVRVANTYEQNGITVVNNTDITFAYTGTYEITYSIQFFNNDNAQQDINVWFYKNGNNNITNSDSKFTINGKSGTSKGKLIAVTPFISTFNAGDYVRLAWAATDTGVEITTDAAGTAPATPVVPGVIVTVKQISNIISAPPGTNSQLIFNDSGISNATAGFTFNKTTNNVTIGNNLFVTSTVNASALTVDNKFIANSTYVYSNGIYLSPLSGNPGNTASGSVFYDLNNHALNVYNDTATPMELGLSTYVRVYNPTGSTITRGTAVYIDGANSNRSTIAKAISNSTLTQAKAIGVVFDDITATSEGFVLTNGLLQNFDTRNYTAGQEIYISATTAGSLSNADPSYPNYTAPIGYALNSALVGQIYISTENPSINLPNTSIYISNGTGPIVSNNFQYDYANNVLKVGNSTTNATIGYVNTAGTTTFMKLDGVANASLDSVIVNYSDGTNSSSDFAAYDSNGPSSYNFIDMGISGVNFSQSYWTIGGASDGYLYTGNSSLTIGTAQAFPIKFFTGDTLAANERMRISATGNVGIGNTNPQDALSVKGASYLGGNVTITGNLIVTGTTVSVNTTTLDVKDLNITVAKGAATAVLADGAGLTVDTAGVGWYYNNGSNTWQSNVGITPSANLSFNLGTAGLFWSNVYANSINAINLYGTLHTSSQPNITANNATYLNGVASASYVQNTDSRTLSGNLNFSGTNNYFNTIVKIGANVYANTSHLFVGNSTVNSTHESAQIQVANTSQHANLNAGILYLGNSTVSASVNSTTYTGAANAATYINGNTAADLRGYSDTQAATAYSNATSYADTKAGTAYTNATSYTDTKAAAAYSNATSYADTKASAAYTNAIGYSGNAALAYSNAIAYSGNAALAYSNAIAYSGNAALAYSNAVAAIATSTANAANYLGTVAAANYVQNTDSRVLSGNLNFSGANNYFNSAVYVGANVSVNTTAINVGNATAYGRIQKTYVIVVDPTNQTRAIIDAIGGLETGNVATNSYAYYFGDSATIVSNTTGTVYGAYLSPSSVSANSPSAVLSIGTYGNTSTGGAKVNTSVISIGNNTVNASINTTAFSGTANNANNLGGVAAASYVQNTDSRVLSGNLNFTGVNNYFSNTVKIGANVFANTSHLFVGNATVNATHEAAQIQVANTTLFANLNAGSLYLGNSTVTSSLNSISLNIGTNFIANTSQVTIGDGIELSANGSVGGAGQVLTSNGVSGSPYWSTIVTGSAAVTRQQYTASGSQTVFTVTTGYAANNLDVYLNGVKLQNGVEVDVSSGTTFTILSGTPVSGTIIEVVGTASGASVITNKTSYRVVTSSDTINATTDTLLLANSSSPITLTLPTLALGNGYTYTVKNINTGAVTVAASGSELIDGYSNLVIQYKYSTVGFLSTSAGWIIV
jgi:hypothetical protein